MENPSYNSLVPRNLIMTTTSCFYCGAPDAMIRETERLFGLKHCPMHKNAAIRDCRAYLHTNKMVRMKDAFAHPIIGQLMTYIKELSGFPVLRSSGIYQEGWILNTNQIMYPTNLVCTDDWMIPVINVKENTMKYISICSFKTTHPELTESIDKAIFCLIDGIYSKEFEEVNLPEVYPELPIVEPIVFNNYAGRVLVLPTKVHEENPEKP